MIFPARVFSESAVRKMKAAFRMRNRNTRKDPNRPWKADLGLIDAQGVNYAENCLAIISLDDPPLILLLLCDALLLLYHAVVEG
ncbi:hypothetical protein JTB14_013776 [Gonioctena quinquepunctata]|nr:hypothetical protein JTB14_013776 [Gonioctena quinquepunctata]